MRVRRYVGRFSLPFPAIRPHFFGACPKKRCRAAKEKRFEATTSPWWAHPPLPFGRKPQRDKLMRQVGLYTVGKLARQSQLDAVGCDVGASSSWERRVGPNSCRGGTQARFFGAPPRFFAQEQRNGVERAAGGIDFYPRRRRTRSRAQIRCRLVFAFYVCADTLGGGRWPVLRFDPISLVLAQRNGVEPPKKGAFFTSAAPPFA